MKKNLKKTILSFCSALTYNILKIETASAEPIQALYGVPQPEYGVPYNPPYDPIPTTEISKSHPPTPRYSMSADDIKKRDNALYTMIFAPTALMIFILAFLIYKFNHKRKK